jgi:DNA processing protein
VSRMQERTALLCLAAAADHVGSRKTWRLFTESASAIDAWHADRAELQRAGFTPNNIDRWMDQHRHVDGPALEAVLDRWNIEMLVRSREHYPPLLAAIPDPPFALFVRGSRDALSSESIGFVGTRRATSYGTLATQMLVQPLAAAGVTITSGLAYGIDAIAHRTTLEAQGRTVAVLGTGVDPASIYPSRHRSLADAIVELGGAVVSEYLPGTSGIPMHFPARNRIIAGLSHGVVVVEAPIKSGALITARFALDFGREVFAVPGPITSPNHEGVHMLLAHGATPATTAASIAEALELGELLRSPADTPCYDGLAAQILDALDHDPLHITALLDAVDAGAAELSRALTSLELDGAVRDIGGSRYVRAVASASSPLQRRAQ